MTHWSEALPSNACFEAVEWARTQPDYATAWASCARADWMLWLIGELDPSAPMSDERRPIVRCAVEIAATVRHLMPSAGTACLDMVSRWCDGADVSTAEITDAARDAGAAAGDAGAAAWATARAAAWDAAGAAWATARTAAWDAARDAWDAARDAWATARAAGDAAGDAAWDAAWDAGDAAGDAALRSYAEIVRRHYPTPPVLR